eukprot:CAMPEP_0206632810 /NCGR_PEP_ID=MMETSP0325_2-20121206/69119_1 /ASSEMBLY_ACC=CAM_ASM_000347 /TAXON_ID=2866 /ORGANISM="Crypthecodinium cohnii, Strain Seligo" /LENGTH=100 /DNA_ID=CAMNT_0054158389 /DNA_START=322 /DNA_END=624 /DNA_ORIENTATION=-
MIRLCLATSAGLKTPLLCRYKSFSNRDQELLFGTDERLAEGDQSSRGSIPFGDGCAPVPAVLVLTGRIVMGEPTIMSEPRRLVFEAVGLNRILAFTGYPG